MRRAGSSTARRSTAPRACGRRLLSYPDAFVQTMTEKLLMYAVGRVAHHYDMPAVRAIAREAARNDYRFSSLVLAIVKSDPFQMRRSDRRRAERDAQSQ